MAHFNRERIPNASCTRRDRALTDISSAPAKISPGTTTAKLFNAIGKKTPTFIRFSTVGGEKGSADTERDPSGFASEILHRGRQLDMTATTHRCFSSAIH